MLLSPVQTQVFLHAALPRKPVACNQGLFSINYVLLWGMVAHHFRLLGFLGRPQLRATYVQVGSLAWIPSSTYQGDPTGTPKQAPQQQGRNMARHV